MHPPTATTRQRATLIAVLFLITSSFGFLQPFAPLYLESAGLSKLEIGITVGLASGVALLLQPLWGWLSDLLDARRPFIILAAVSTGFAYLGYRQAATHSTFLFLSAVGANGTLYLNSVGGVLVGRMVASSRGGAAYAGYRVWGSVGYIVVTLTTGLLLNPKGLKLDRHILDQVFTYGPYIFFAIAALALALPDFRRMAGQVRKKTTLVLTTNLRWFLASYFLYIFALYGASGFLALYMKSRGGSPLWITAMFAGGVVCEVLVMRQSGRLSDRFGRRPLLSLAFLLLPFRLALYALAISPPMVFAVQLLHGINFGIMGAIAIALVNDISDDETRGRAQARLSMVAGAASALSPITFGYIAERQGLPVMFLFASGLAGVAALIFMFRVHETHPESSAVHESAPEWLRKGAKWLDQPPSRTES